MNVSLREFQSWESAGAAERRHVVTKTHKKTILFMHLPSPKGLSESFSEMSRCKAPEIQKSEAYLVYAATMKDKGNAADGRS